jgi:hypothetical protein
MKLLFSMGILLLTLSNSCEGQENKDEITINYTAQTRGYIYTLQLKNKELEINNNQAIKNIVLTEEQQNEVLKLLSEIDFKKIKSNISTDDLAVDKAIKGAFELNYHNKLYSYNFDHNKLPKKIEELKLKLETLLN